MYSNSSLLWKIITWIHTCAKCESSQSHESRAQSLDSSKAWFLQPS